MYIDQIEIQNFRCFERLKLDLHPNLNVLIGENGAGKTAILEASKVAFGGWLQFIGGFPTSDVHADDIRIVGRSIGQGTTFEPQYPLRVIAHGMLIGHQVEWSRVVDQESDQAGRRLAPALRQPATEIAHAISSGEPITVPLIAYYGAGRLWSSSGDDEDYYSSLKQRELSRLEGYRDALAARTSARELIRWLEYQDRVAYQEEYKSPLYLAVLQAMRGMVERAAAVRFDAKRLEMVVEFEGGEVQPFAHLSDGQRNMLALAGDIAMRMARLNPQYASDVLKQTPGIVLIDELDLHLHPRWQRHIAADLGRVFPLIQFVTTTHSPQIVSEVQPECVTILERQGDQVVAYKANQAYGLDTNGVLQRLMNDPGRPAPVREKIEEADDALEEGNLNGARKIADELRRMMHGEDPEVIRIDTSIYALEALSDAVD